MRLQLLIQADCLLATFKTQKRVNVGVRMDIYPGETQPLDVAARIAQDTERYGWSNEQYFSQPFGRNLKRKLDRGQWLVRVLVTSSGQN